MECPKAQSSKFKIEPKKALTWFPWWTTIEYFMFFMPLEIRQFLPPLKFKWNTVFYYHWYIYIYINK